MLFERMLGAILAKFAIGKHEDTYQEWTASGRAGGVGASSFYETRSDRQLCEFVAPEP